MNMIKACSIFFVLLGEKTYEIDKNIRQQRGHGPHTFYLLVVDTHVNKALFY